MGHIGLGEILVIIIVAICVLKPSQLHSLSFLLGKFCGSATEQIRKIKREFNQTMKPPQA